MTRSGIDLDALDPDVRPQDDLNAHVNGRWAAAHVIPEDRAMDGAFRVLHDRAEEQVRDIILEASAAQEPTPAERRIGAMYSSFMDAATINARGITPISGEFDAIAAAPDGATLAGLLGSLQRAGADTAIGWWVDNDADDPTRYVIYLTQGGLGLPDEAYYREEQHASVLAAYRTHVARILGLVGVVDAADAADAADRVVALETALAAGHWDVVKDRDADLTYNPMTFEALIELAPGFGWQEWLGALEAPDGAFADVVVRQPGFFSTFGELWTTVPLADWKLWAAYHVASSRAPYLHDELVQANFDFYGTTLSGAQALRERWKRGVSVVQGALGEAVGQVYVDRHFPSEHKAKMDRLVGYLIEAYRESITELDWMGEATRERALAKLDAFTPKIGYPVRWRDYSTLELTSDDIVANVRSSSAFETDRELGKIGKPIDRDEWFMTPQTVNAYYNAGMNEIVFPAAILQPPFFYADADDAANFGAIGAVIGHEIGHGFDDQGSKYDGEGRLNDWWTADDRAEFEARTRALIGQYDEMRPSQLGEDDRVNGELTIGENIGDLGGLSIAIRAYRIALGTHLDDAPVIDGFTGLQRLFLSWAQVWRSKGRDEELRRRLATDPHSPDEWRCNGVVRNVPEFAEAFGLTGSDRLWLAPQQRVRIW